MFNENKLNNKKLKDMCLYSLKDIGKCSTLNLELVTQHISATWILWSKQSFRSLEQSIIISYFIPLWKVPYQNIYLKQSTYTSRLSILATWENSGLFINVQWSADNTTFTVFYGIDI